MKDKKLKWGLYDMQKIYIYIFNKNLLDTLHILYTTYSEL